jgi:hypothetical protein
MIERITYLGKYELIEDGWLGPLVEEGTIRLIEGVMHSAEDFVKDEYNPCTQNNGVKYSKWMRIAIRADGSTE